MNHTIAKLKASRNYTGKNTSTLPEKPTKCIFKRLTCMPEADTSGDEHTT